MGGKTTTSTNKVTIPQDVLDRYNAVNAQAQQVAQNPFQKYGTKPEDFVAQFNEQQLKGVQGINAVAGMGPVYENVDKYMSPYIKNVADTTRAQIEQANEQAQSGALGTAVQSGAFGGDRAGVAAANLANQQNLAMGSTMANIYNQGYTQAVDTSMNDMNRMLGVAGQQLGVGTQMQQTEQAGKDALINQFMQEQGYPFQVAQFLANIAMGTGALSGSTTTSTQTAPFFSDRRLKHDIKKIGEADNGLPIYTFKYKGDENHQTHVGFMADEVEKKNPDAVGLDPSGYKTVDYDKAAQSMGGGVHARHSGENFADGGVAGPYGSKVGQGVGMGSYVPQAYLPVGELMVADPADLAQHESAMDTLNSMAGLGKSVMEIRDSFRKEARGGVVDGYAGGGGVQPPLHSDYLSGTLAAQEKDKEKPELKVAGQQDQPKSGFENVANALGAIASIASLIPSDRRLKHDIKRIGKTENGLPIYTFKYKGDDRQQTHIGFMADEVEKDHPSAVGERNGYKTVDYSQAHKFADGGVAGYRNGYALDGAVEDRIRDVMRKAAAAENDMRLTRDEVPAAQTLGSLPDAKVVAAEAPTGVAPSGYVGPNSRAEARERLTNLPRLGISEQIQPTKEQAIDYMISQGVPISSDSFMPPRPTGMAAEAPTGVVPEVENDMTLPEYLSSFRLNERIPAGLASIGNIIAAPIAGAVGIGAGLAGAPDFGNAAMNFAGDRIDDWKEAGLAALGTDSQIAEMYRRSAAENLAAENAAANQAIAAAPLTVDQRPKPRPVVGGVAPEKYIGPNSRSEAANYYLGLNKPTDDQLLDVLISQGLTEPGDNLLPPAPTGVVPVSAPVEGQVRPMPRPEGLGAAAAPVVPAKPAADTRRKIASVIGSGDGFIDVEYTDGTRDRIVGDRNFRNNNPGNMEYGDLAKKYGAVGTDGRFAVFPDYETGRRAKEALLFESGVYDGKTIISAIEKYAPLGDGNNNPEEYAKNVAAALGVSVNTPLSSLTPEQRSTMMTAMEKEEGSGSGLSTFSTTPLGADGSPVPLRGGVAGGVGGEGVAGGAGSQGRRGGLKPYEERNWLGKIMHNKDGTMNKDAMLSLLAGLGDMLSSPSPFLLPAIGAGLSGAAKTYMAREGQVADIAKTQADTASTATQLFKNSIYYNEALGQTFVPLQGGGVQNFADFMVKPAGPSMAGAAADQAMRSIASNAESRGIDLSTATPEQIFGGGSAPVPTPAAGMPVPQVVAPYESFGTFPLDAADKAYIKQAEARSRSAMTPQERQDLTAQAAKARAAADSGTAAASLAFRNTNELAYTVAKAASNNDLGPLGAYKASFEGLATQVADQFGIQYNGSAASSEALLNKLSSLSADQMTADTAAASLYLQNKGIFPSIDSDPVAAAEITAEIMTKNMNAYEKGQFINDLYRAQTGTVKDLTGADARFNEKAGGVYQVEKTNISDLLKYAGNANADQELQKLVVDFFDSANRGDFQDQADAQAALEAIFSVLPGQHKVSTGLGRYFVQQGNP